MRIDADIDMPQALEILYNSEVHRVELEKAVDALDALMKQEITPGQFKERIGIPDMTDFSLQYTIAKMMSVLPVAFEQAKKALAAEEEVSKITSQLQALPSQMQNDSPTNSGGESSNGSNNVDSEKPVMQDDCSPSI